MHTYIHINIHTYICLYTPPSQGQEWTLEEDLEVMQELKNIRLGVLSHKNMTAREAEKIQHVLKVSCLPLRKP